MNSKTFTIHDLERFSGIKSHTLRIWELRYAILRPIRTSSNFRLYSLEELKKILDIALLNRNGYKISGLANNNSADIENKIRLLPHDHNKWEKAINDLTINMYNLDPTSFEWLLDELLLIWSIEVLVEKIIYPFLKVTRLLWVGNKLYEEHLVVTAIRKKLILAIETAHVTPKEGATILLFLPDGKQLDLGLLYSNYFFKTRGIGVLYLGTDVTITNLKIILHIQPPEFIFTYLSQNHHFPTHELLDCMNLYSPHTKLIIGDYNFQNSTVSLEKFAQMDFDEALNFLQVSIKKDH